MRFIVTGDRGWDGKELATRVVARLIARYDRANLGVLHGAASGGVDSAFDNALWWAWVKKDPHPADSWLGDRAVPKRNRDMIAKGAGLCIAVHRLLGKSNGRGIATSRRSRRETRRG
jgi:hypothetical protein